LGYTASDLVDQTFGTDRKRVLTTELHSGEAMVLVMFTMLDTNHLLMIETTDYTAAVDEAVMEWVAPLLVEVKTDELTDSDGLSLRKLAGQLTLLEEVADRYERDAERKADVDTLKEAVAKYQEANSGQLPTDGEKVIRAYISGEFADPKGEDYTVQIDLYEDGLKEKGAVNDLRNSFAMHLVTRATCSGQQATGSENSRNFAVLYRLEDGTIYCVDNK